MDKSENFDLAMSAAHELARTAANQGSNHAKCIELRDQIDNLVGRWVWTGDKHVMRWPAPISAAAGEYGRRPHAESAS